MKELTRADFPITLARFDNIPRDIIPISILKHRPKKLGTFMVQTDFSQGIFTVLSMDEVKDADTNKG